MKSHIQLKPLFGIFLLIFGLLPTFGFGQLTLNNTTDGSSQTAVLSGAGAGQFNCGSTFVDAGGPAANYTFAADGSWTITLCAPSPTTYIEVNFSFVKVNTGGPGNDDIFTYNVGAGEVTIPAIGFNPHPNFFKVTGALGGCITFTLNTGLSGSNEGFLGTINCFAPPSNDNPCTAAPLSVFTSCNYTTVSNIGATNSTSVTAPPCGGYGSGNDVWYTAVVPSNGILTLTFAQNGGTLPDAAAAIYSSSNGTCNGTFTLRVCNDDGGVNFMPAVATTLAMGLAGQTVWIRLWNYEALAQEGTFDVCATGASSCANPTTNDCAGAMPLCSDSPVSNLASGQGCVADLNAGNDGCLAGEHNSSWFLIQIGTTGTWGFNGVFDVSSNGIEYDWALWQVNGNPLTNPTLCGALSSPIRCSYATQTGKSETSMGMVSNQPEFFENGSPSGDGYVHWLDNATTGEFYLLMIDRWSTAGGGFTLDFTGSASMDCAFIPLPIELLSFTGIREYRNNRLHWITVSENNNDYFTIEKSEDLENWDIVGIQNGAGNSSQELSYSLIDENPFLGMSYYRLRQTDFDGNSKLSHTIALASNVEANGLFTNLMPNPSNESFYFNYAGQNFNEPIELILYNFSGQIVSRTIFDSFSKHEGMIISTNELSNGIYKVEITQGDHKENRKISVIH